MKNAFTLVELMVVIAITAILAAIIFPVIVKAKDRGHHAEAISNMRQAMATIHLYASENDDYMPTYRYLQKNADLTIWHDARDDWQIPKNERTGPLIGSFAYSPSLVSNSPDFDFDTWEDFSMSSPKWDKFPVLLNIFPATKRPRIAFHGNFCNNNYPGIDGCETANKALVAFSDGSVSNCNDPGYDKPKIGEPFISFSWQYTSLMCGRRSN